MRPSLRLLWWTIFLAFTSMALLTIAAAPADAAPGWQSPLRPERVTRGFAPPPTVYAAGHRGVDLAGVAGERVGAAAAGTVTFAGQLAGRGVVVVTHGALRTTYEPVIAAVRRGDQVTPGQLLGTLAVGHVGCPVSACLHWGLLRGEVYLDPLSELSSQLIRLLPPGGFGAANRLEGQVRQVATTRAIGPRSPLPPSPAGPSATAWSLAAIVGMSTIMIFRRR